jgi:glyoxylase-like metal-dependent hydrolase (beta-lactamase superfamily II)
MYPSVQQKRGQRSFIARCGTAALTSAAVLLFAGFAFRSFAAAQDYPPLNEPLKIERVPGTPIFYTTGHPGIPSHVNQGHTSNAGFVITSKGILVFDALGTPSLGWALLQEIRKRTSLPVRYNVLSHYHADHIYGLQAFRDHTDTIIIAQDRAREYKEDNAETSEERSQQRLDQRRQALAPWVNKDTRVVAPDVTFADRMTVTLGDHTFEMIYAGPAHSASDMMMMVEPEGVLFAGDIVQNGRIPFMNAEDVNTKQWAAALNEVLKLNPKLIIPGHGRPSPAAKEAIAFTRDYIQYVRTAMAQAVESWTDFDAAYQKIDWSKYEKMPAFAANNRGNAYRIYIELEGGQFSTPKQ